MSFLDSLENNLKALESREEKDPAALAKEQQRRQADRASAQQRAPFAEQLKKSQFTSDLLTHCRTIGHGKRTLVQFTWLDETLRLDAKEKRLELMPTTSGIEAIYSENGAEVRRIPLDLHGNPESVAREWLAD